jgi:putative polyketide hydroxylase
MMEAEERTPVLVVGGALTGLSSAVFLGVHGVRALLVERHPDLLIHPRLRGLTPRAVEAFRQVGLEPAIRDASFATGEGYTWVPVRADTLAGEHTLAEESDEGERPATRVRPGSRRSTRTSWRYCCAARPPSSAPTCALPPS